MKEGGNAMTDRRPGSNRSIGQDGDACVFTLRSVSTKTVMHFQTKGGPPVSLIAVGLLGLFGNHLH
jgi:hypothetical protein